MSKRDEKRCLKIFKALLAADPVVWEPKNPCSSYGTPGFKRLQELHNEALCIRTTICPIRCAFTWACNKDGQNVLDCPVVVKERGLKL